MKIFTAAATAMALSVTATAGFAACDDGEIVVKFAHVTNTDKHPKGIAASLLENRVNRAAPRLPGRGNEPGAIRQENQGGDHTASASSDCQFWQPRRSQ